MATVRALTRHGGGGSGDLPALRRGCENLARQVTNVRAFGIPVVVAVNAFLEDRVEALAIVREAAHAAGARAAEVSTHFSDGGDGALALARAVRDAADEGGRFRLLYPDAMPLREKVETIAVTLYGAEGIELTRAAAAQLTDVETLGAGQLPVCVAKTPASLSHDPSLGASPRGFRLPVREVRLAAGAAFVTVVTGDVALMPGLPAHPAAEEIDVDPDGRIVGLR